MYLTGRGVDSNLIEARKWLTLSAESGDARGQTNLAVMYLVGDGVTKNDTKAAMWMRKAANQGFAAGQFGLGSMYAHGQGVPKSEIEAVNWYRKAATQGNTAALNNLAILLSTSSDPKIVNKKEAVTLAEKAVSLEPNNASYLDTLASAYFEDNERAKAAEAEQRALALKPDNEAYKKALEQYQPTQ